jgi:hypothetical protein
MPVADEDRMSHDAIALQGMKSLVVNRRRRHSRSASAEWAKARSAVPTRLFAKAARQFH